MDPRRPIFEIVRADLERRRLKLLQPAVEAGDAWLDSIGFPRAAAALADPAWTAIGRALIGQREIPGPKHNPVILSFWRYARWLTSDEDAWCGGFIMHCLDKAGLPFPRDYPKALSWASYGVPCPAQPGAIGVKKRVGGNHVFFIIGETPDKRFFKVLHGNAQNMVCIGDIAKADVFAIRWPAGVPQQLAPLPRMAPGTISTNEA